MCTTAIIIIIIIIIVTGALGAIKKGLEKYVDKIPGINEFKKFTLLATAHILRTVLSIK